MKSSTVLSAIWDINDEIQAESNGIVNLLQFWSNGEDSSVMFMDKEIWSSDMKKIDDIEEFLKNKIYKEIM